MVRGVLSYYLEHPGQPVQLFDSPLVGSRHVGVEVGLLFDEESLKRFHSCLRAGLANFVIIETPFCKIADGGPLPERELQMSVFGILFSSAHSWRNQPNLTALAHGILSVQQFSDGSRRCGGLWCLRKQILDAPFNLSILGYRPSRIRAA
jgi:hypothetical protein